MRFLLAPTGSSVIDAFGPSNNEEGLRAVVEEAHRHGKKVAQHVTMDPNHLAARQAIVAGVDAIEHAFITDETVLRDMARKGIFYVPTIWIIDYISRQERGFKLSDAVEEFALLADATGDSWMALRAGTIVAAEMLGKDAEIGSIKAGKLADIVAMPGNPLDDITVTERVSFVMKDGEVIRDRGRAGVDR